MAAAVDPPAAALRIAVVEDHDDLRALTVELLRAQGYQAVGLASAEALDAWRSSREGAPAGLFVIDLNLPGEDGLSLARRLRVAHPQAGIVMVTARGRTDDRIEGYGHGADLYLAKPVSPAELLAAIAALARRLVPTQSIQALQAVQPVPPPPASLTLDRSSLTLIGPAATAVLTPTEAALIEALAQAPRRQLALERIGELLGYSPEQLNKASLEVRVVRLRRKLVEAGAGGSAIKAVRGFGYQLGTPLVVR